MTTSSAELDVHLSRLTLAARRHANTVPWLAVSAITAAVDELSDPTVLPRLQVAHLNERAELTAVVSDVRRELLALLDKSEDVVEMVALASAARELAQALVILSAETSPELRG